MIGVHRFNHYVFKRLSRQLSETYAMYVRYMLYKAFYFSMTQVTTREGRIPEYAFPRPPRFQVVSTSLFIILKLVSCVSLQHKSQTKQLLWLILSFFSPIAFSFKNRNLFQGVLALIQTSSFMVKVQAVSTLRLLRSLYLSNLCPCPSFTPDGTQLSYFSR